MIDESLIEKRLINILQHLYNEEIIILNTAGLGSERPDLPYIGFRIDSLTPIGWDEPSPIDSSGNRTIRGNREFIWHLEYFSNAFAVGNLEKMAINRMENSFKDKLIENEMVMVDISTVRRVPRQISTEYEDRAFLDINMRVASILQLTGRGFIESAEITGGVRDAKNNVLRTIEISVGQE